MSQKNNDFFNQFLNNELPKETPLESKPYEKAFTQQPVKSTPTPKIEVDLRQTVKSEPEKVEVNSPKGPGVSIKTDEKYERFINPNKKRNQIIALITGAVAVLSVIFYLIFGNKVEVPDFSAYTPSQIATWGTKNNMTMLYVEEYNHEFEKGTLISQNIAPGKKVKKGGEMTLVMSLGIDPEVIVTLPDFDETWTTDELMNWIDENNLMNATIKNLADETIEKNHFIKSDLDKDLTEIKRKTKVTFYVSTGSPFMMSMIDLKTKTEDDVKAWAQKNNVTVVYEKVAHDTVPENQIITQSIEPEIEFNPKTETLTVEVSTGTGITVPSLNSMTIEEIKAWATANTVNLMLTEKYHNSVAANTIIESSISSGEVIKKGDLVTITISLGKVGVKNFIGDTEISFMEWVDEQNLKGANITPSITYQYVDSAEKNKIIAQSLYDRRVETGANIQIVVNLGGHLTVPALTGLSEYDARQTCEYSGLTCVFTYDYSNAPDGTIASQDRQAGYNASEGDIMNVIISKGPRP
ncbi:PASTA domain-containing protein [Turicibacter sanguinis]|uniref:PASTA domain-containing protein n=1 Tax=Turicibacter sanguinis TaxID=154288 RepID=UPI0029428196|nr:PASTA domain-containing protein [Turicibacter sanguinis]